MNRLEKNSTLGRPATLEEPEDYGLHLLLERNDPNHEYYIPPVAPFLSANLVQLYREFDKTSSYAFFKQIVRFYKFLFPKVSLHITSHDSDCVL